MPVTKHNEPARHRPDPQAVAEARSIAASGRPGPVLVDVPKDILQATTEWSWPSTTDLPGYRPVTRPNGKRVREAAALLRQARRPVLYVGGGVTKAEAEAAFRELAEAASAGHHHPDGPGAFPDSHPALGMPGMHGNYAAVAAFQEADLLVALGARFDDRVTGNLATFAPKARIVHADIDPAEIGKNRASPTCPSSATSSWWWRSWRRPTRPRWRPRGPATPRPGSGPPASGRNASRSATTSRTWAAQAPARGRAGVGPDRRRGGGGGRVGQHQMYAAQHFRFDRPRSWINWAVGTMGFAVPAAMGAKVGRPDELVVAIDGDGCFQMTAQELATCTTERIPIKVLILNNGHLGMVRQWQELFYDERYSEVHLGFECPDYVKLAEAYGALGLRRDRATDVDATLRRRWPPTTSRWWWTSGSTPTKASFSMVPAGRPNDEIILGPELPEEQAAATCREVRA